MIEHKELFADSLALIGQTAGNLQVTLSSDLVRLLSEQLYQSPLKAVEELVVNAYDADATECRVYVPEPAADRQRFVVVYDNGVGMDGKGLENLWYIGHSTKREKQVQKQAKRKQIGKFGIGKLATYTIANKLTYISRTGKTILLVTLDFSELTNDPTGGQIRLPVILVTDWRRLRDNAALIDACSAAKVGLDNLLVGDSKSWTIAILENLKDKTRKIKLGRLRRVLSTAMPLKSDFQLYLNGEGVDSAKESYDTVVDFDITELPQKRLDSLRKSTGEQWRVVKNRLVSDLFVEGVSGSVIVTEKTLLGKSDDITRSHGYFIKVRDRLVNESDELFGVPAKSFTTFYRFRADLQADDLDSVLTAPREGVEESKLRDTFQALLEEIFNEARQRYEEYLENLAKKNKTKTEEKRNFVNPQLIEYPVADVLATQQANQEGAEADESWFYLDVGTAIDRKALVASLYNNDRHKYHFEYYKRGASERLVRFNPTTSTFEINDDHPMVIAHKDDGRAGILLEEFSIAEALLEVYLRESQIAPHIVGEVLERRDALLRSLAVDRPFSLAAIQRSLLDAASDERDLEVALVAAARALGFVATQISNAGQPDGIARFTDYPGGEKKIILEAKSTEDVPQLPQLDFAGLRQHVTDQSADGCLLVAPSYPGGTRGEASSVAKRAREQQISCWTIEQLARFVGEAEARQLTARQVLDIVLHNFSPDEVSTAIDHLFVKPNWDMHSLYRAILESLRQLEGQLVDAPRSVDMIAVVITAKAEFRGIEKNTIATAVKNLAAASQGGITFRDEGNIIVMHASYDEIERRLEGLTKKPGAPMRASSLRD